MAFFFLLQREGGGDGVSGGGGRRRRWGERKEPSVSVCVRARGCSRWSLLSQRVALRPSPVAVCEGGREPGSLSFLSLSPLSLSPCPPFSLCLCVCACARVVAGGGERGRRRGQGRGRWRGGEEDAEARTPTDDWLPIARGTGGARGRAPSANPLRGRGATFPGSPAARPPSSRRLRAPPPAHRAVDYFLLPSEIIVWKGWKEGVSATLAACGVCVRACAGVCVNKLVWVSWLGGGGLSKEPQRSCLFEACS